MKCSMWLMSRLWGIGEIAWGDWESPCMSAEIFEYNTLASGLQSGVRTTQGLSEWYTGVWEESIKTWLSIQKMWERIYALLISNMDWHWYSHLVRISDRQRDCYVQRILREGWDPQHWEVSLRTLFILKANYHLSAIYVYLVKWIYVLYYLGWLT